MNMYLPSSKRFFAESSHFSRNLLSLAKLLSRSRENIELILIGLLRRKRRYEKRWLSKRAGRGTTGEVTASDSSVIGDAAIDGVSTTTAALATMDRLMIAVKISVTIRVCVNFSVPGGWSFVTV